MKPFLLIALAAIALTPAGASPLRLTPNIQSFSIYELTGTTAVYLENANSFLLANKLNTIYTQVPDFQTLASERFDYYYSDANGVFDVDGEYLTLDCTYDGPGSGCNIAEVELNPLGAPGYRATSVVRFVSSFGYIPGSELLAIDGDPNTAASLGNSEGTIMSMTFGFNNQGSNSQVPEPSTYALMTVGLAGLAWSRRK